jgi:bifunctional oligoribonuclease and PAP phosphatase NrnA
VIFKNLENKKQLIELLANKPKVLITTHINPDGDAVGSLIGLYLYFKKQGFPVWAITPNEYPDFLGWMAGNKEVIDFTRKRSHAKKIIREAQVIFHLDYNEIKRSGDMAEELSKSTAYKVMIDHHPNPQLDVNCEISRTDASSTAELVFELLAESFPQPFDKDICESIYTGIMTDTGCFNYNSSRTRTFEIVSKLLEFGIRKDEIFRNVYDNFSASRMRLLGYCLNDKLQVLPEYNTAYMSISLEEQQKFNFSTGDSEGFVNYPLSIKGICFTALFIERKDRVKISFRSQGNFPTNTFSQNHFAGGGHVNASGGESSLTLDETIHKFLELLPNYKEMLNHG